MADAANQVNLNEPRSLAGFYNKRAPVTTFIRDTFFPVVQTYLTEHIDLDFRKGTQNIAPFVANGVGGVNIARQGFVTRTYTPPRVAPQRQISPEVLQPRLPGETLHTTMSPEERQQYFLEQDAQELDDFITRREEVMAAELITTGKITVKGYIDENKENYIENTIDFRFDNFMELTSSDKWDADGSDRYGDLVYATEQIFKAGYAARHAIFGAQAWKLLEQDEAFQKKFDLLRYDIGKIVPELRLQNGNGVKYLGYIADLGLDLWVYYAWYVDEDGVMKPYIPENFVVIAPEGIGEMVYGAITQLEDKGAGPKYYTYEGTRVPKTFGDVVNDRMMYRLSSRPLPRPHDVDMWASLKVK